MSFFAGFVFGSIGLAALAGGFVGYKKAHSKASLVAGTLSGAALLTAAGLSLSGHVNAALALGGGTCLALAGRFFPSYLRTRRWMPAGVMAVLAGSGVLTALIGLFNR